ncbi:MAG: phosphoadenylyl-sulfate reductase [Pseudomonadota bacterium]
MKTRSDEARRPADLVEPQQLEAMTAEDRIAWSLAELPGEHILSSSFGAQSAVMLHLLVSQKPDLPVVFIDTGYLFPETYRFVDSLTRRLALNLKVYRSELSSAWQEARYGRRWEDGLEGLDAYNRDNKVLPMERALNELSAGTWFSGVRRSQSGSRADKPVAESSGDRWKVHPIADWSDRDVYQYLKRHDLPYHPLWEQGYVSIGDVHSTQKLAEAGSAEASRFFGLKRECGLHEMEFGRTG